MAYDGLVTWAIVKELNTKILNGKIEKIYQPASDELVFHIHTKNGNLKLFASAGSAHCRIHLIEGTPINPPAPLPFCMLLRKHLQGGRITAIEQKDSERIIEISFEALNELGFTISKKIIFEIMGKHSNIILLDLATNKIIDSIKRVSFDLNRVRQILPGMVYEYPPVQDKIPFKKVTEGDMYALAKQVGSSDDGRGFLQSIAGISPAFSRQLARQKAPYDYLTNILANVDSLNLAPSVYFDHKGNPVEFYLCPLDEYESVSTALKFDCLSKAMEFFFNKKESSNQGRQKAHDLIKSVSTHLDKLYLKKKRLSEDLQKAENSEDFRLYGELLTANLHLVKPGEKSVDVTNYYDGTVISIPLDPKLSPSKNSQHYYKRYGKAKTAVKEKHIQLSENQKEIDYLESVLSFLERSEDVSQIEDIRNELIETGYVKKRKMAGGFKAKAFKAAPIKYTLSNGLRVLVGRNNKENDILTFKMAGKRDIWLHTKDIPGSHVIVFTESSTPGEPEELTDETTIFEAAAIAAYHSKGSTSENVAVDYVQTKYVKKPAGAKPGMVIFTNNRTVWVNPKVPE